MIFWAMTETNMGTGSQIHSYSVETSAISPGLSVTNLVVQTVESEFTGGQSDNQTRWQIFLAVFTEH